ncbi:hypothetical protein COU54_00720 [Candidatus Pacearchaeota archaeon CG10_big_fil_rev_8_21_14_0_10_31_24]|nr:MAG: hypothetical protein COU54_00720 [Candidatus Pacearchaeota archaeon CG10_big_fil_rev_8_21_14_0_10_31_24]
MNKISAKNTKKRFKIYIIILILLSAFILRVYSSNNMPEDDDEGIYLKAANEYRPLINEKNINGIIEYKYNSEHPALTKLIYSVALNLVKPSKQDKKSQIYVGRIISSIIGTAAVGIISLMNPMAGFLFAIQTISIKYTSEMMLEAIPLLACLLSIYFILKSKLSLDKCSIISAISLGLVFGSKISYFPILIPIIFILLKEKKYSLKNFIIYGIIAILTMLLLNVSWWNHPVTEISNTIHYHINYSVGEYVQRVGFPWYQPLKWISHPKIDNQNVFPIYLDTLIFILAIIGLKKEYIKRKWSIVWLFSSVIILLIWPTKWPQYSLIAIPPLCLTASSGISQIFSILKRLFSKNKIKNKK